MKKKKWNRQISFLLVVVLLVTSIPDAGLVLRVLANPSADVVTTTSESEEDLAETAEGNGEAEEEAEREKENLSKTFLPQSGEDLLTEPFTEEETPVMPAAYEMAMTDGLIWSRNAARRNSDLGLYASCFTGRYSL